MELSSRTEEQLRIISVHGARIDASVALEFKDAIREQTDIGPELVVLDLSKVDFIDSSGLGAIVAAMKSLNGKRTIALAGLTPTVEKVFRLTRMDTVFQVFKTLNDALEDLKS